MRQKSTKIKMKKLLRQISLFAILLFSLSPISISALSSPPTGDEGIEWTYILIAGGAVLVVIIFLFLGRKRK